MLPGRTRKHQQPTRHHVLIPKIGPIRTHESTRTLTRQITGGQAKIVRGTLSRTAGRWYLSLTVQVDQPGRGAPSRRQRDGGIVGVDFGVPDLATLSTGQIIPNPRHLEAALGRLASARQTLAYKAAWYGAELYVQDKHHTTNRTCSRCGAERADLRPTREEFRCLECGHVQDRRLNTAAALAAYARRIHVAGTGPETPNARGEGVRPAGPGPDGDPR